MAQPSNTVDERAVHAEYLLLELHLPGAEGVPAGVLLLDPRDDRLHLRTIVRWPHSLDAEDREMLQAIVWELRDRAERESGAALLASFEESWSHTLRLGDRRSTLLLRPERLLEDLFHRHVEGKASPKFVGDLAAEIIPFRSHLPFYPMKIAAGLFDGDMEVEASGWVPVPEGLRPDPGYFVARISGHSMEPRVPDGSFCLFRANPQGSREGKLVLVQKHGASEQGGEFTIKRYHSEKAVLSAGDLEEFDDAAEWRHSRIRLISLNPAYPSWDLEADQCKVVAEFIRVLDDDEVPAELKD